MSMVVIWKGRAFWPSMTRVASEMKLQFMVLLMKGKDREALRLHSMTLTSLSRAMNWMLTGPEMFRASDLGRGPFHLTRASRRLSAMASKELHQTRVTDLLLGLHVELLGR